MQRFILSPSDIPTGPCKVVLTLCSTMNELRCALSSIEVQTLIERPIIPDQINELSTGDDRCGPHLTGIEC